MAESVKYTKKRKQIWKDKAIKNSKHFKTYRKIFRQAFQFYLKNALMPENLISQLCR